LVTLDYGMKDKNPIDNVMFYSKKTPNEADPISEDQKPSFIPGHFKEQQIRIYSKEKDAKFTEMVREASNSWFKKFLEIYSPDEKVKPTNK
ncbi:SAMH1-like protein, partial [Mya arenaria]